MLEVRVRTTRGTSLSHKGNRREISVEMDAAGKTVKEKTHTWNKSRKASAKRETEFYEMVEAAVMDGKQEKERGMIRDLLGEIRKRREEEDEARNLNEEMQRNLDEAQHESLEVERKLDRVLWEYIEAFDKERGRPQLIMTKLWQMMESKDTKNLNLDKDLDEIFSKTEQTGWNESTRTVRFWTQDDEEDQ